jgi:hypothetical protein
MTDRQILQPELGPRDPLSLHCCGLWQRPKRIDTVSHNRTKRAPTGRTHEERVIRPHFGSGRALSLIT